jgi:chromate transporter
LKTNAVWVILVAGTAGLLLPNSRRPPSAQAGPSSRTLAVVAIPATVGPLSLLGSITVTFLKMGVVFFGGGFVLVPVLHHRLVTQLGWLNPREFLDGVAISNLTPGPIAVLATFAGYHVAGVAGALVATAALLAPAMGLMWLMSGQYERYRGDPRVQRFLAGVNPAVTGLILSAAVLLRGSAIGSWRGWILCGVSLLLLRKFRWHPAFVLAIGSVAGYAGVLP